VSLFHLLVATFVAGAAGFTVATSAFVLRAERRSERLRERVLAYVNHES
jgi:hypothetical protein